MLPSTSAVEASGPWAGPRQSRHGAAETSKLKKPHTCLQEACGQWADSRMAATYRLVRVQGGASSCTGVFHADEEAGGRSDRFLDV